MATQELFQEQLTRIDTATTGIAAEITALKDQLTNAGLPSDVEDSVLASLTSMADRLEQMAAPTPPAV